MNLVKPWYVYRPRQLVLRVLRGLRGGSGPRTVTLPWGVPLRIDPIQLIGKSIWRTGVFELLVSEALFRLTEPGDLVVDVGANVGYMSSILGLAAGPGGELHAFEPHPAVYRQFADNAEGFRRLPRFAPLHAHEVALGTEAGVAQLYLNDDFATNDGGGSMTAGTGRAVAVRVERLDDRFAGRTVGVLKVDVEGFEASVLGGAAALLRERRIRDVVYEDHHGPDSACGRLLRGHGYTLFRLAGGLGGLSLVPADAGGPATAWESPSYLATRNPERALARCQRRGWQALRR